MADIQHIPVCDNEHEGSTSMTILSSRGIELDEANRTAKLHGKPLSLSPKEFDCLAELVRAGGSPISAQEMFERVWHAEYTTSSHNAVMVYMRHLRKKLAELSPSEEFIETVWGVGYRIIPQSSVSHEHKKDI